MSNAYLTRDQLVAEVQIRLREASPNILSGTALTQSFEQREIYSKLISRFRTLYEDTKINWPQFTVYSSLTSSGTDGIITNLASVLTRWQDLKGLYRQNTHRKIALMPSTRHPNSYRGSRIQGYYLHPTNVIRVVPHEAIETIDVVSKVWPFATAPISTTVFPMDSELLILGTVMDMLDMDDDNPNAADKVQEQYEKLYTTFLNAMAGPVPLNPRRAGIDMLDGWYQTRP